MSVHQKINILLQENYQENNLLFDKMFENMLSMIGQRWRAKEVTTVQELLKALNQTKMTLWDILKMGGLDKKLQTSNKAYYRLLKKQRVPVKFFHTEEEGGHAGFVVMRGLFKLQIADLQVSILPHMAEYIFRNGPASIDRIQYALGWATGTLRDAFRHEMQHTAQVVDKEVNHQTSQVVRLSGPRKEFLEYMRQNVNMKEDELLYHLLPVEMEAHISMKLSALVRKYYGTMEYRKGLPVMITYRNMAPADFLAMNNKSFFIMKKALEYRPGPKVHYDVEYFSTVLAVYKRTLVEFDKILNTITPKEDPNG